MSKVPPNDIFLFPSTHSLFRLHHYTYGAQKTKKVQKKEEKTNNCISRERRQTKKINNITLQDYRIQTHFALKSRTQGLPAYLPQLKAHKCVVVKKKGLSANHRPPNRLPANHRPPNAGEDCLLKPCPRRLKTPTTGVQPIKCSASIMSCCRRMMALTCRPCVSCIFAIDARITRTGVTPPSDTEQKQRGKRGHG